MVASLSAAPCCPLPQTVAATLERAGFKLVDLSFASPAHDPFGRMESAINRLSRRANTLTRSLRGLDPFGPAVLSFFLAAVLFFAGPALGGRELARRERGSDAGDCPRFDSQWLMNQRGFPSPRRDQHGRHLPV